MCVCVCVRACVREQWVERVFRSSLKIGERESVKQLSTTPLNSLNPERPNMAARTRDIAREKRCEQQRKEGEMEQAKRLI